MQNALSLLARNHAIEIRPTAGQDEDYESHKPQHVRMRCGHVADRSRSPGASGSCMANRPRARVLRRDCL